MWYSEKNSSIDSVSKALPEARVAFLKKVYFTFLSSLGLTAVGGFFGLQNVDWIMQGWNFLILIGVELICFFSALALRKREGINKFVLWAFSFLNGATLAPLLALAISVAGGKTTLITEAFIITGFIFTGLTFYVFMTKKDFSFLRGALIVGLFALIGFGILSIFFSGLHENMIQLVFCGAGALIFAGFILYDTSQIMLHYDEDEYISAAIDLQLDFINMFVFLLRMIILLGLMFGDD